MKPDETYEDEATHTAWVAEVRRRKAELDAGGETSPVSELVEDLRAEADELRRRNKEAL